MAQYYTERFNKKCVYGFSKLTSLLGTLTAQLRKYAMRNARQELPLSCVKAATHMYCQVLNLDPILLTVQ